jgi:hypothetical protein
MECPADVRVPPLAHVALPAGCGGINCDAEAGEKGASVSRNGIVPAPFDDPGKFVSEDERGRHMRVPDACVIVRVEIASTDAGRGNAYEHLTRTGRRRIGEILHPQVARGVETDAGHFRECTLPDTGRLSGD